MPTDLRLQAVELVRGGRKLLDRVDFAPQPGRLTVVIGPNGAGKTSLIRVACGYEEPTAGSVTLRGHSLEGLSSHQRAAAIGWLPQGVATPWAMPGEALLRLSVGPAPAPRDIHFAIERMGLDDLRDRPADQLSGGERQRLQIARAMCRPRPILLADEPVEALDPRWQIATMDWLRERADSGATVVAVLHDLPLAARYADHVVAMTAGRIANEGPPHQAMSDAALRALYGVAIDLHGAMGSAR